MSNAQPDRLRVLAFAGSLREASLNRALLRAAVELAPDAMAVELVTLHRIPLFDEDVEKQGDPEPVAELKSAIAAADALLVASPEYNFGITGVLKNAIDWASRPPGKSALRGKPVAIVGATPGGGGTRLSQAMLRQVLTAVSARVLPEPLFLLAGARDKIQDGRLQDPATREHLRRVLEALGDWVVRLRGEGPLHRSGTAGGAAV